MKVYRKRDHWEDREDSEWRIEPDALVYRNARNEEHRFPWASVAGVRAEWRKKGNRSSHVCSVWLSGEERSRCEFDNVHVETVGEHEYREDYSRFLNAVLVKIIEKSPAAKAWMGTSPGLYPLQLLGLAALLIVAVMLLVSETALTTKVTMLAAVGVWAFLVVRTRPQSMPVSKLLEVVSR